MDRFDYRDAVTRGQASVRAALWFFMRLFYGPLFWPIIIVNAIGWARCVHAGVQDLTFAEAGSNSRRMPSSARSVSSLVKAAVDAVLVGQCHLRPPGFSVRMDRARERARETGEDHPGRSRCHPSWVRSRPHPGNAR